MRYDTRTGFTSLVASGIAKGVPGMGVDVREPSNELRADLTDEPELCGGVPRRAVLIGGN